MTALTQLYRLWFQPGAVMTSGWWTVLNLHAWQDQYQRYVLVRPAVDRTLRQRLGHAGPPPALSPLARDILDGGQRLDQLRLSLGLWALQGADYLRIKRYRTKVAETLDAQPLKQLQALLPRKPIDSSLCAEQLVRFASGLGNAWLSASDDPAVRLCRLTYSPDAQPTPSLALNPVLEKLMRWL